MKLLFDHNLSPRLVGRLHDLFPDASHLFALGMNESTDSIVWEYARTNGFCIVTKDKDFSARSVLFRHPPKVIRLHLGNCTTAAVEQLLRESFDVIAEFDVARHKSCLHLPPQAWA